MYQYSNSQKKYRNPAAISFDKEKNKGRTMPPPPLQLRAQPIQMNSEEEEANPTWGGLKEVFSMGKAKLSAGADLTEWYNSKHKDSKQPSSESTGPGKKLARGVGIGLDAGSEFTSRKSEGASTLDALIASGTKGGISALTSSKKYSDQFDELSKKPASQTPSGKDRLRSGTKVGASMMQSLGALSGNETLEDVGKVAEVVSDLNPKDLVQKGIEEGLMGYTDLGLALSKGDKTKAMSDLHDQNLAGNRGDIRQGGAMIASVVSSEGRKDIARMGSNGKLKGLGRVGWKAGGLMSKHDVLGFKSKERKSWQNSIQMKWYREALKAVYGDTSPHRIKMKEVNFQFSSSSEKKALFKALIPILREKDRGLYRLFLRKGYGD